MDWSASTQWWLAAGLLVAAELATGTFYLLMLALGSAAGALAGHLGLGVIAQMLVAALVGAGATAAWHFKRMRHPRSAPAASNRDVNLDIGETVRVDHWDEAGQARVNYRGAGWTVRFDGSGAPLPGEHVIVGIDGTRLRVQPVGH